MEYRRNTFLLAIDSKAPPKKQDKKDKSDIKYSYLKCLPTFKGLVMSLTDSKRVTTAYYELKQPFINNINLSVNGSQYTIPLSQGLNVIIGDNSSSIKTFKK